MADEIFFDSVQYISASDAAQEAGLTRDHIARLCRENKVLGKQVGKNWYVSAPSLQSFLLTQGHSHFSRGDVIFFNGVQHISASTAAREAGLTRDHVARLCRENKVPGKQVGKSWYVSWPLFQSFLLTQAHAHSSRSEELSLQRVSEYRTVQNQDNVSAKPGATGTRLSNVNQFATDFVRLSAVALNSSLNASRLNQLERPINSAVELVNKLTALVVALALTVGTYAMVDKQFARYAEDTVRSVALALNNPNRVISLGENIKDQLAAVALNPSGTFVGMMSNLARSFNANVDRFVYAIAFPNGDLPVQDYFADSGARGTVAVSIDPYKTSASTPTESIAQANTGARAASSTTIINNPVVERIVPSTGAATTGGQTERIVSMGGISEDILNRKLQQLDNKLTSQMFSLSSANSTQIAQNYVVTAQTNRIDQLANVAIAGATITGSTFAGSVAGTTGSFNDLSATALSAGTTTITNLSVTNTSASVFAGPLTVTGAFSANNNLFTINGTTTAENQLTITRIPFSPHSFISWSTGVSNSSVTDATLLINPATALADTNLFGIAVGGSAKLLVDAEGDLFVHSLTSVGATTLSTTTASTFTVENTLNVGDAIGDTFNIYPGITSYLNLSTSTISDNMVNAWSIATSTSVTPIFSIDTTGGGRVGIGTAAPAYKLDVTGNGRFTSYVDAANFIATSSSATSLFNGHLTIIGNTSLSNATSTNFFSGTASSTNLFAQTASLGALSANTLNLSGLGTFTSGFLSNASSTITSGLFSMMGGASTTNLTASGTGYFGLGQFTSTSGTTTIATGQGFTIGDSQFVVQQGSGNVGIGTTTPDSIFSINNVANFVTSATSSIYGALQTQNLIPFGPYTNNLASYDLGATGSRWNALWAGTLNVGTSTFSIKSDANSNLGFFTAAGGGGTQALTITSAGNVGIGTTTPAYTLDVNGTLRAGSIAAEATGGTITHSGGYTIHTFTTSGTFIVPANFASTSVEYLVVAGGGAGGTEDGGGGGGAGGMLTGTQTVSAQSYTITVGQGGTFSTTEAQGQSGSNSVFGSIVATGGGGGAGLSGAGVAGGSGGGGMVPGTTAGGAGTVGQGHNGGSAFNGTSRLGGGGGGASAVGVTGSNSVNPDGGAGTVSSISGSPVTYAGGGGGGSFLIGAPGAGGAGGGGGGGTLAGGNAVNGTANTGGGGGGAGDFSNHGSKGGSGGSGIVIVRYLTPTSVPTISAIFRNNVGIGTTTPLSALDVNGGAAIGSYAGSNTAPDNGLIVSGNVGIGTTSPASLFSVAGNGYFTGNVGIGTASPGAKLHIVGADNQLALKISGATTGYTYAVFSNTGGGLSIGKESSTGATLVVGGLPYASVISDDSARALQFGTSNTARMTIDSTGNVGIGTTNPLALLHINGGSGASLEYLRMSGAAGNFPQYAFARSGSNDLSLNMYNSGSNGSLVGTPMTFQWSTGNVGIGNTDPGHRLEVQASGVSTDPFDVTSFGRTVHAFYVSLDASNNASVHVRGSSNTDQVVLNTTSGFGIQVTSANPLGAANVGTAGGTVAVFDSNGSLYKQSSSERYKNSIIHNWTTADLNTFLALNPIKYQYNSQPGIEYLGFSAEETGAVLPILVNLGNDGLPESLKNDGFMVYTHLVQQELNARTSFISSASTSTILTVDALGNVGIGTTTPQHRLQVAGDVAAEAFVNNSSRDLKTDITNIATATEDTILTQLQTTNVYTYRYKDEPDTNPLRMGLIVDSAPTEVLSVSGDGVDVYKLAAFTLAGVKAQGRKIEALNLNLEAIAGTTTSTPESQSFATSFFSNIFTRITAWLADAGNGVETIFARTFSGETICLKDTNGQTCISRQQLDSLLASASSATASSTSSTPTDTEAPVITLNGNNPATINIGTTYGDLGAIVTDNVSQNLGLYASVGGGATTTPEQITIDTSTTTTYTILYSATDQAGNTGTATRTVDVVDPNATTTPAL